MKWIRRAEVSDGRGGFFVKETREDGVTIETDPAVSGWTRIYFPHKLTFAIVTALLAALPEKERLNAKLPDITTIDRLDCFDGPWSIEKAKETVDQLVPRQGPKPKQIRVDTFGDCLPNPCDRLPLYRDIQTLRREGWRILHVYGARTTGIEILHEPNTTLRVDLFDVLVEREEEVA